MVNEENKWSKEVMVIVNVKMAIKSVLLASVITSLIGLSSMASAGSSGHGDKSRQEGSERSQATARRSLATTAVEKLNDQSCADNDTTHALDTYLDWHNRWKLGQQKPSRSDS